MDDFFSAAQGDGIVITHMNVLARRVGPVNANVVFVGMLPLKGVISFKDVRRRIRLYEDQD